MIVTELRIKVKMQLMVLAKEKGYLNINDILKYAEISDLAIDEVDRLCDLIISDGVIIGDEEITTFEEPDKNDTSIYNKSQLDYDKIYNKVLKIDNSLIWYIEKVKSIKPPQIGEEALLIYHAKEGNEYARERLITMFLKVALRIALWHHEKFKFPLDETIQDANIGLLLALDKFPIERNIRFSTYAPWWIRQYIMRKTQGLSKIFYDIPAHMKDKLISVIKVRDRHDCSNCISMSFCPVLLQDIINQMNCNAQMAVAYLNLLQEPFSVEELVDNDDVRLFDYSEGADELFEVTYLEVLSQHIEKKLAQLKERNRKVLEERFGLIDGNPKTLEEVGITVGVTRERIRQIEAKTLEKLRKSLGLQFNI